MKYIFRGHVIFEYLPYLKYGDKVVQHYIFDSIPGFNY